MVARTGYYALAVSAAMVMASVAMLSDDAMAQADDVTAQVEEAPVATVEAAAQDDDAAVQDDDVAVQDEVVEQPVPKQKPAAVERPVKSDLDQSAVRAATVKSSPRPTRTSTRGIALPKILGSYR